MMAHLDKYTRQDLKRILKETYREFDDPTKYENEVDISRSTNNYSMKGYKNSYEMIRALDDRVDEILAEKMDGKPPRLPVKFGSWVITCPKELQDDPEAVKKFFEMFFEFCQDRYGVKNVLDGVVHLDETSPHMTCYIVPECQSRKSGKWTISAATRFQRNELQTFHSDFDKICEKVFCIEHLVTRSAEEKAVDPKNRTMQEYRRDRSIQEGLMDVYQEMTEDAAEQARQIIDDAKKQAEEIIRQAKQSQPAEDPAEKQKAAQAMKQATQMIRDLKGQVMSMASVIASSPMMSVDDAIVLSAVDDEDWRWHYREIYDRKHWDKDTPLVEKAKKARDLPDVSQIKIDQGLDFQMS